MTEQELQELERLTRLRPGTLGEFSAQRSAIVAANGSAGASRRPTSLTASTPASGIEQAPRRPVIPAIRPGDRIHVFNGIGAPDLGMSQAELRAALERARQHLSK